MPWRGHQFSSVILWQVYKDPDGSQTNYSRDLDFGLLEDHRWVSTHPVRLISTLLEDEVSV